MGWEPWDRKGDMQGTEVSGGGLNSLGNSGTERVRKQSEEQDLGGYGIRENSP